MNTLLSFLLIASLVAQAPVRSGYVLRLVIDGKTVELVFPNEQDCRNALNAAGNEGIRVTISCQYWGVI